MVFRTCQALLLAGCVLASACGPSESQRRVVFETYVTGLGGAQPFVNEPPEGIDPWTVSLTEAHALLGPVYLFEGEPLISRLWRSAIIGQAYAHPGHYQEGAALGEMLDQQLVDLLRPEPTLLGVMDAVTGQAGSAQVGIGLPEQGGADGVLGGHSVRVRGIATRGAESVDFVAFLDMDQYVEGVAFEQAVTSEPGSLLLAVDLERWLRRVDFATAKETEPGEPALCTDDSQAGNAFLRGVDNTLAFSLQWRDQ